MLASPFWSYAFQTAVFPVGATSRGLRSGLVVAEAASGAGAAGRGGVVTAKLRAVTDAQPGRCHWQADRH